MFNEIKELKEVEIKSEEFGIKILRKRYKNEIKEVKILTEQKIELETKKQKKEDKKEHRIGIDTIISDAEDLKITAKIKLNKMQRIKTEINKLEKDRDLDCINVMEIDSNNNAECP